MTAPMTTTPLDPRAVDPVRPAVYVPRADPGRGSRVSVVRRCSYAKWLPELARGCACWRCQTRTINEGRE